MTRKKVTVAKGKVVKEETLADVIANDPLARNEIRAKARGYGTLIRLRHRV